jgi:flagellar motor switch protein FliN
MEADRARPQATADSAGAPSAPEAVLAPLTDVPITVTIRLGSTELSLGELMALRPGAVLGLDQQVESPAEILVGNRVIALGQMVMVGKELGVRVLELGPRVMAE